MYSKFKYLTKEILAAIMATNDYSEILSEMVRGEVIELEALIGLPVLKRIGDKVDDWDVISQETAENSRSLDEDKAHLAEKPLSDLVRAGLEVMRETFGD